MRVVVLDSFTSNPGDLSWAELQSLGDCTFYDRTRPSEVIERAAGADVVLTNKVPMTRATIESLPDLRYIGVLATGYNVVDVQAARERSIPVTNVPGYSTASVAQLVFALLLELTNHVGHHSTEVTAGRWSSCADFCFVDYPIVELEGKTLGIIGYGDIGSRVAAIGHALGMRVLASKRNWSTPPPSFVRPTTTEQIWAESDAISLHCPLTPDTQHLVNRDTLALMKSTSYLINTARGPLVKDEDLAEALNAGSIGGAGLDVMTTEPPPPGNPLFTAKNCVITPHQGWASHAARARLIAATVKNIRSWAAGCPTNVVNPA
jgi:glycerate dehydrogenase